MERDSRHINSPLAVQADGLLHRADSLTLQLGGDIRMALMGGRMFVMQVAHPAVGAGVWQHSAFREDPWKRLREIRESGNRFLYNGADAARAEGERLRELHRGIKGTDDQGRAYHALNPQTYGWVHAVFLDTTFAMHELFADPLTRAQQETLFLEWREGGRFFGLREVDLPATLDDYLAFWNDAMRDTVEYSPIVAHLLDPAANIPPPPGWASWVPATPWQRLWRPAGRFSQWLTLATLPPAFRARLPSALHPHLAWTDDDQQRFDRFRQRVRATVSRLPRRLRYTGDAWRAMRRKKRMV